MAHPPLILLIGASGQVGSALTPLLRSLGTVLAPDRREFDLTNPSGVRAMIRSTRPRVIINAAAYTAVDRAESEPEKAFQVNSDAPAVLAEEAERIASLLVHYSTDYV